MSNNQVITSANTILMWKTGDIDITDSSGNTEKYDGFSPVGIGVKVNTFEMDYKTERVYGIGDKLADGVYSKGFGGNISFDMVVSDSSETNISNFLNMLLYNNDSGAAYFPDTVNLDLYIYFGLDTYLDKNSTYIDLNTVDVYKLVGFTPESIKLNMRSEEYVVMSVSGRYKSMDGYTVPSGYNGAKMSIGEVYANPSTFVNGGITIDSGEFDANTFTYTKSVDVDIKYNPKDIYVIGSPYPSEFVGQKIGIDVNIVCYMDKDVFESLINSMKDVDNFNGVNSYFPNGVLTLNFSSNYSMKLSGLYIVNVSTSMESANVLEVKMKMYALSYFE